MNETEKLMHKLAELEKEVERLKERKEKPNCIAVLCNNEPYRCIRYDYTNKTYYFATFKGEVWNKFRDMAKMLFLRDKDFYGDPKQYIGRTPSRITDMTTEEMNIAAEFMDEVITIFNKYFTKINSHLVVNGEEVEVKYEEL